MPFPKPAMPGQVPAAPGPLKPVEFPHGHSRSPLFAVIGLFIALLALGGGGYVLAQNGTRIPLLYTLVSGLKPGAVAASADGIAKTQSHKSYQFRAQITLQATGGSSNLPTDTSGAQEVYKLDNEVASGQFTNLGASFVEDGSLASNAATPVSLVLREDSGKAAAYFPGSSSATTVAYTPDDLSKTMLKAVMPMSAETLMKAVRTETAYQKETLSATAISRYDVTYDCASLQAAMPVTGTLSSCTGYVALNWKNTQGTSSLPVAAHLGATLTYQSKSYVYSAEYRYDGWDAALGSDQGNLVLINSADLASLGTPLAIADIVARAGISFDTLPHDTSLGASITTGSTDTPSATPTPTASPAASSSPTATPLASPSPSATPALITPSGKTVSTLQAALSTNPSVPVQPASAAATQRDTQRKQDLKDIASALAAYHAATGIYPAITTADQLAANSKLFTALVGKYISAMPVDPLSDTYYYSYVSTATGFRLRCVIENGSDSQATKGGTYYYYDLTN
jgi:Type II secretion system (T2SS), protein G